MKEDFKRYLAGIEAQNQIGDIDFILEHYAPLFGEEIGDIFFELFYERESDSYKYGNLFFFSNNYLFIVKNYGEFGKSGENLLLLPINKKIDCLEIFSKKYNFHETTSASRLEVTYKLTSGDKVQIKAESRNCKFLKEIILKYIKPKLLI